MLRAGGAVLFEKAEGPADGNRKVLSEARGGTGSNVARPLWLGQVEREIESLSRPESVGLIAGDRAAGLAVLEELGGVLGVDPVSVTEVGVSRTSVRSWQELLERAGGVSVVVRFGGALLASVAEG